MAITRSTDGKKGQYIAGDATDPFVLSDWSENGAATGLNVTAAGQLEWNCGNTTQAAVQNDVLGLFGKAMIQQRAFSTNEGWCGVGFLFDDAGSADWDPVWTAWEIDFSDRFFLHDRLADAHIAPESPPQTVTPKGNGTYDIAGWVDRVNDRAEAYDFDSGTRLAGDLPISRAADLPLGCVSLKDEVRIIEFYVHADKVVTVNGIPSGGKAQLRDGSNLLLAEQAEVGGTATIDALPIWMADVVKVEIRDGTDTLLDSISPSDGVWGGDVYDASGLTANNPPATPTISFTEITHEGVTLVGSTFSDPNADNHAASQWQVDEAGGAFADPVFDSGEDTVNLESREVTGLSPSTVYTARVRYKDDSGDPDTEWSSWSPSGYAAAVLDDNPVAYWRLDEEEGTVAADETGNGHDAAYAGNPALGQPSALASGDGFSVGLDGSDEVELNNGAEVHDTKPSLPLSFEGFFRLPDVGTEIVRLVSNDKYYSGGFGADYYGAWMDVNNTGVMALAFGDGGSASPSSRRTKLGSTVLLENTFYHLVGVIRSPTDMDIYIDAVDDGGTYEGSGDALAYSSNPGSIGENDGQAVDADEVAIYDYALSEAQVSTHLNAQTPPTFTTLESPPEPLGDVRMFLGAGADVLAITDAPSEPGADPIQALLRTNAIAPGGAGGEAVFTNLHLVAVSQDAASITVTPILDGEEITAEAVDISIPAGGGREQHRFEIGLARTSGGSRQALRGTWFAAKIEASYVQAGRPLVLEGISVEAEVVTEGVEDRTFTEEQLALRAQSVPSKWFVGSGAEVLEGGVGPDDDGVALEARAESNALAPVGVGGEAIFTNIYLTLQRDHSADLELRVTPILDGVAQDPLTLTLAATTSPVRDQHEFGLYGTRTSGGKVYSHALRGTWMAVRVETVGALPSGRLVVEGIEVEAEPVGELEGASNAIP